MSRIKIAFYTDNAAFEDGMSEVDYILEQVNSAVKMFISTGEQDDFCRLIDSNGNHVGSVSFADRDD